MGGRLVVMASAINRPTLRAEPQELRHDHRSGIRGGHRGQQVEPADPGVAEARALFGVSVDLRRLIHSGQLQRKVDALQIRKSQQSIRSGLRTRYARQPDG
ncbi:hypothetical protein [Corynebacterium efficiens YS-314]|uniref:Uncharacterized protein n=1 Tax=Corynebacterium efficiens (strain DSM 44549 / YS-314 / AJ 12310 / JCM 11189 / NBRC 100395) TaxID=196164 RepID=Q8FLL4_COREF|nr:hypothetical protein [Corynebacterium efficiens YS-314]